MPKTIEIEIYRATDYKLTDLVGRVCEAQGVEEEEEEEGVAHMVLRLPICAIFTFD